MQWQPRETFSIRVDRDVPVTMRDGTVLMTDVYRPAAEGRYPVLLQRTPYNKETGGCRWSRPTPSAPSAAATRSLSRIAAAATAPTATSARSCRRLPMVTMPSSGAAASPGRTATSACMGHPTSGPRSGWPPSPSRRACAPSPRPSCFRLLRGWTYQGGAFEWGFMCNWVLLSHHGRPAAHQRAAGRAGLR